MHAVTHHKKIPLDNACIKTRIKNTLLCPFSGVQNAIRRRHVLEGNKLDVKAYYPFLQDTTPPKKTEIPIDRDVLEFIKRNYVSELEEVVS